MQLTNIHNLPKGIYNAINNDTYDGPGIESDKISVTTLISPPRIYFLKKRHWDDISEDTSDCLWRLLGSAVHAILERAESKNHIVEERLEREIDGITVSGKMDIMDEALIEDYKVTSVWQYIFNPEGKPEHTAQLNVLRWLSDPIFPKVSELRVNMILRDWNARQSKTKKDYPPIPFVSIKVPVWTLEQTEEYVRERVSLYKFCRDLSDDKLPMCTDEENWNGRRCESYCPVSKFCKGV